MDGISFTVHPCISFSFWFLTPRVESDPEILHDDEYLLAPLTCIFRRIFVRPVSHQIRILWLYRWSVAAGHRHAWWLVPRRRSPVATAVEETSLATAAGLAAVAKRPRAARASALGRAGLSIPACLGRAGWPRTARVPCRCARSGSLEAWSWTSLEASLASPRWRGCWLPACRVLRERTFRGEWGGRSLPATACRNLRYFLSPSTNRFEA